MAKGWFEIPGVQKGDRTLEQQLKGLEAPLAIAQGSSVMDFGCAEGMISREFAKRGARRVVGVEYIQASVDRAAQICKGLPCEFYQRDLNCMDAEAVREATPAQFDITLALAILHKLRDPFILTDYMAKTTRGMIVVRLPASTPGFVQDRRSGNLKFDVTGRLARAGFGLRDQAAGHFEEWVGIYVHIRT